MPYPKQGPNAKCKKCGKAFHIAPSKLAAGRGVYCSRECAKPARKTDPDAEKKAAEAKGARAAEAKNHGPDGKFLPGNMANPGGRPKTAVISAAYRAVLSQVCDLPDKALQTLGVPIGATWAEALAKASVRKAVLGDSAARTSVLNYTEGAPRQSIDVTERKYDDMTLEEMFAAMDRYRESVLGGPAKPGRGKSTR